MAKLMTANEVAILTMEYNSLNKQWSGAIAKHQIEIEQRMQEIRSLLATQQKLAQVARDSYL